MKQDGHGSDEHRQVPVRSPDHFRSCCFKIQDCALAFEQKPGRFTRIAARVDGIPIGFEVFQRTLDDLDVRSAAACLNEGEYEQRTVSDIMSVVSRLAYRRR
jgi:hypothetical protein